MAAEVPPTLVSRTNAWELGKRYEYGVALSTRVSFDGKASNFDFDLTAKLDIVPSSVSAEIATLHLVLRDVRVVSRAEGDPGELERMAAELRRAWAFLTLSGGLMTALDVPPELSDMAMGTYRQLGAALQVARAADDGATYTAEEHDSTGKYLAEYERAADGRSLRKRKQRYLGLLGVKALPDSGGLSVTPQVFASLGEVRLTPEGRPEAVKLLDEIGLRGASSPLRSKVSLELSAVSTTLAPARDLAPLLREARHIAAGDPLHPVTSARALDDARIGNLDFDTIVSELERLRSSKLEQAVTTADDPVIRTGAPTTGGEVQESARRFMALAALFRKDPGAVNKAVAKIRAQSPATSDLIDTLSSASTPAAQRALIGLLGTKGIDKAHRSHLIFSLARSEEPTAEATAALRAVLETEAFHAGALYGLGTHARLYRDLGRAEEARKVGEFLLTRLRAAPGPSSLGTVLRAIANSGYDGALAEVTGKLSDKREEVRVAALRALQSMRNPRADELLAHYLLEDASPKARLSAIEAATIREPSERLVAALELAATTDSDSHVRYRSVELIARWLPQRPRMRAALEQVARKDEEAKVRERAKALL